jgi:hypothetical protein
MSTLDIGHFQGLASKQEFVHNIGIVSDAADEGRSAGFIAQRHGKNPGVQVLDVEFIDENDHSDRTFEFIPEDALDNVGAYVVGRPLYDEDGQRRLPAYLPLSSDMETFCQVQERSPKVISGIAIPLALGGSAVLFFRESETEAFNRDAALSLPFTHIETQTELTRLFRCVGLNLSVIRYDGSKPFNGSVNPLFR